MSVALKDLSPAARRLAIAAGAQDVPRAKGRDKFSATRIQINGVWFDSKTEARYVTGLMLDQRAGSIRDLTLQRQFALVVNNEKTGEPVEIGVFTPDADFIVVDPRRCPLPGHKVGDWVVLDVKSKGTVRERDYKFRKKAFEARYGIALTEVVL